MTHSTLPFLELKQHLQRTIVGQHRLLERLLISVLTEGHQLVEGLPGLAKTTAVRTLAAGMALRFQRIQFTPDMIPGDITGTDILVPAEGQFRFIEGPIFYEIILADEINRAPPKVQSALLEAMQEHQVTVGGTTRPLPAEFMVMATQNPIEQDGTYPLPEAQLDRFFMIVTSDYPSADDELEVLRRETLRLRGAADEAPPPAIGESEVRAARAAVNHIYLDQMLERYAVALVHATREPTRWDDELASWLARGASPRATLALARCARARAYLAGRDFVEPDDIMNVAPDVLNHRIGLSFAARAETVPPATVIARIHERVPAPYCAGGALGARTTAPPLQHHRPGAQPRRTRRAATARPAPPPRAAPASDGPLGGPGAIAVPRPRPWRRRGCRSTCSRCGR